MEKILIVDTEKCNGCGICQLVCSMAKHGEYNPKKSWIKLIRNREMDVNIVALDVRCDFCNQCVEWCFPKALKFDSWENAAVVRKENKIGKFPAPLLSWD